MIQKLVLVYLVLKQTNGQGLSDLFPADDENINDESVNSEEFLSKPSEVFLNDEAASLTDALNMFTRVPYKIETLFDPGEVPSRSDSASTKRALERFVAEYEEGKKNVDIALSFKQLVVKYGHEFESYEVLTKDGYVLALFRIPANGPVVFLMHGLLGSADDFILAGYKTGLAYMLAELGYDVWLGNARGNKHSRRHINVDPSEASFWDFTWHEIGVHDLPAMIDYVLDKTKAETLKYIGHSQGTTCFFVMVSEKPDYNKKVSLMIALSPVAFMSHVRSPMVRLLSPGTTILQAMSNTLGQHEFLPNCKFTKTLKRIICGTGILSETLCTNPIFLLSGYDYSQLNVTNLPMIFAHFPSGGSMKQFAHYGQGLISEDFRQFDYGSMENLERYGQMVPPSYNLDRIETPISMIFSSSDWFADPKDVATLSFKLKNVVHMHRIPHEHFNHVDFIIAKDVKQLVYKKLIKFLPTF